MIGCDIDGTTIGPNGQRTGFWPEEADFVFITGRKSDDWTNTVKQVGTDHPIYLRPMFFAGDSPHWKAHMIQSLRITKFYEDDFNQAYEIRRACPDCLLVMVRDGKVVDIVE